MSPTRYALAAWLLGVMKLAALSAEEPHSPAPLQLAPDVLKRCMSTLRSGLHSSEFWPAMHAAEGLTRAGAADEVLVALRDRLPLEQDDQRRCGLARELVRAGDRGPLAVLFDILGDEHSAGRVHAAESLYKLGEAGDGRRLREAFEQTQSPQLRLMAAAALARAGHADALAVLREQLRSGDRPARNTAAFALARLGGKSDVELLRSALAAETDASARAILASALASLGHAKSREALKRNLHAADASVRATSAEFAGQARCFECQAELVRLLDDPTLDVRVRAAQSLIALSLPATKR